MVLRVKRESIEYRKRHVWHVPPSDWQLLLFGVSHLTRQGCLLVGPCRTLHFGHSLSASDHSCNCFT